MAGLTGFLFRSFSRNVHTGKVAGDNLAFYFKYNQLIFKYLIDCFFACTM